MHRSGTSAVTRLIGYLGATLPNDAIATRPDNPTGFWESAQLVGLHDELLVAACTRWYDLRPVDLSLVQPDILASILDRMGNAVREVFCGSDLFVVKDPRICRLVPIWRSIVGGLGAEAKVVLILRDPDEVSASLESRDRITASYADLLWLRHVVEAESQTRDLPRVVVTYDEVMRDWAAVLRRVTQMLDRPWQEPTPALRSEVEEFLRPELRHHHNDALQAPRSPIRQVYEALCRLSVVDDVETRDQIDRLVKAAEMSPPEVIDIMQLEIQARADVADALRAKMAEQGRNNKRSQTLDKTMIAQQRDVIAGLSERSSRAEGRVAEQNARIADLHGQLADTKRVLENHKSALENYKSALERSQASIDQLRASLSWRVTSPFRFLGRSMRRIAAILRKAKLGNGRTE